MTKVRIKINKKDVEAALENSDFEQAPAGVYVAELKAVTQEHAKGSDGQPDKNRPYLSCVYRIVGVGKDGASLNGKNYSRLFDNVSFSEAARWKMVQFATAMGIPIKNGAIDSNVEIEEGKPGSIIGTRVLMTVVSGENREGEYRANVKSVKALDSDDSGLFEDDDEDEDDEEFDSEEENEDEEEDDEEESEYLTEEGLAELALKELKEIAEGDFDLDADDLVVRLKSGKVNRKKTQAAIIEAILEAQGADEEDEEEEPF